MSAETFDPMKFFGAKKGPEKQPEKAKEKQPEKVEKKEVSVETKPEIKSEKEKPASPIESGVASQQMGGAGVLSESKQEDRDDFSQENVVSLGTKVARYPISKFRGVQGFIRRIAIPSTKKIYAVKTHYDPDIRSFYCFEGLCCDYSDPMVRYLFPILVYDTDKEGNIISAKFTIEFLALSESYYNSILLMHKSYPLDTVDILVSCTDERYQKNSFQAGGETTWKKNENFAKKVGEEYIRREKHIIRAYAKRLGKTKVEAEATYRRLKGDDEGGSDSSPVANFDLDKFANKRK